MGLVQVDVGHQHRELVPAQPGQQQVAAERRDLGGEAPSDDLQQRVSRVVAQRVVDLLEPVEVEQDERHRATHRPVEHRLLRALVEQAPVAHLGQVVGQRLLARGRQVAHPGERLDRAATAGEQRGRREQDHDVRSVSGRRDGQHDERHQGGQTDDPQRGEADLGPGLTR